ncbi:hypothetical protein [Pseudoalteromonas mariniglutinosa]|uniref:hypothetical protein n=1 Tax=Pseudoalteromonas mariniglutinosa TaxID=206042 RepID=UPI0038510056
MTRNNYLSLFACLSIATSLLSTQSYADQQCQLADNSIDASKSYIQCLDLVLDKLYRQQKIWQNKITMDLERIEQDTGNTQLLPIFQRSITNHMRYLEDSCRWRYLQKMPNSTAAAITYKQCEINILQQHIAVLNKPIK